ncbi:MAG: AmpG family muropeptide MFS transporter [Alphaproteobacteria bacterium]
MTERTGIRGWLDATAVYRDRRVVVLLFLGFSSGLPLLLTLSTLSIWLAREGVDKTTIGLFALAGLPYTLKFVWSPLVDRVNIPLLTRGLGRRRGWLIVTQLALMASIVALGNADPATDLAAMAWIALVVAFCSASQDIVVDAYRIDLLEEYQQGAGAATYMGGYRVAMLTSGAGALFLADQMSWGAVYVIMALLITVGTITVLLSPEPAGNGAAIAREDRERAEAIRRSHPLLPAPLAGAAAWAQGAAIDPFADFMRRQSWIVILLFILLYKFGDAFAGVMANPFYVEMGFTNTEIASVSKIFGLIATLGGVFLGGLFVIRYGAMRSLLVCGVLQMLSNLMFAVQAMVGYSVPMLTVTIAVENFTGGMATAAFVAYLSGLCNLAYTATQYALLTSFMAFGRTVLASSGGWMADQFDWVTFFVISTIVALPGLLLLWWMMHRGVTPQATAPATDVPR